MATYKIIYDKEACIGAGSCEAANPDNWKLDQSEGKAIVTRTEISDTELEKNLEAMRACPAACIKIINAETGEELK